MMLSNSAAKLLALIGVNVVLLTRGVELTQNDFAYGSYVITSPGLYTFEEDIVFHPNGHLALNHSQPEDFLFPTLEQLGPLGAYRGAEYSLGFFAALVIASDNVVVDLKGHRLEQSPGHALMQRFYAHIEVANSPFPGGAGPASFATKESFVAVKNVTIKGGTLGLSAHHSIHGNGCELVTITDMTLTDFEVAGISLNSAKGVVVNNVDIKNSRRDVPISGRFSQAIFALRTATRLLDLDPALSATSSVQRAVQRLRSVVSPVIANVSEGHPVMYPLFASLTSGLPDGSLVAGLLFHPKVHVGDFLHPHQIDTYAQDISIDTVNIYNLSVAPIEIAALRKLPEEAEYAGGYEANQVHDNSGGVLDVDTIRDPETEKYVGTPLSELQLTLATYGIECQRKVSANSSVVPVCLQKEGSEALLKRNKISSEILKWAGRSITFSELLNTHRFELVPNFDYMFHFNKGVIGIKLDGVTTASMNNVDVSHLENHATQQERSILFQTAGGYRGFDSRAVAISSSAEVTGEVSIRNIYSKHGAGVYAADVRNNSTKTVLDLDNALLPSSDVLLNGTLPANDPIFSRSGCPFAGASQDTGSNNPIDNAAYQTAVYALVATQVFTLLLLALGAYCVCCGSHSTKQTSHTKPFKPLFDEPQDRLA